MLGDKTTFGKTWGEAKWVKMFGESWGPAKAYGCALKIQFSFELCVF
jgi:hypothetical protein